KIAYTASSGMTKNKGVRLQTFLSLHVKSSNWRNETKRFAPGALQRRAFSLEIAMNRTLAGRAASPHASPQPDTRNHHARNPTIEPMGGSPTTTQTTQQQSTTNPWAPAAPILSGILGKLGGAVDAAGLSPQETAAFGQLTANAQAGNPYAGAIGDTANAL